MRITVKPYLLKRRKRTDGKIPIYIRITQAGKYSLIYTGIEIDKASQWNKKYRKLETGRDAHPSAKVFNHKLDKLINEIQGYITTAELNSENVSYKDISSRVKSDPDVRFFPFSISYSETLLKKKQVYSSGHIKTAANKLVEFAGNDLRFSEITPKLLNGFQEWMDEKLPGRVKEIGSHPNTIVKTMGSIRSIIRAARKAGHTKIWPFDDELYERPVAIETTKDALSIDQIEAIQILELEQGSELWHTRNIFMFQFWNSGIRISDAIRMKWGNIIDGRLKYGMSKSTKKGVVVTWKNIDLLPGAIEILNLYRTDQSGPDDYIFPFIKEKGLDEIHEGKKAQSANATINKKLKVIQEMAGIQINLSSHIARHSFARWLDASDIMSIKDIQKALGHKKLTTTMRYLASIDEYKNDDKMKRLIESRKEKI